MLRYSYNPKLNYLQKNIRGNVINLENENSLTTVKTRGFDHCGRGTRKKFAGIGKKVKNAKFFKNSNRKKKKTLKCKGDNWT